MSELKIEYLPTGDLIPYARNSRTHTDEQVAQVAASIREFGFASPVLIGEDKTIIAGHCRVMAAQKLGLETVPTVTATGWTEAQKRAYVIVDNRLAENAGWDVEMLKTEFADLDDLGFDLSLLGFDESEIDDLLADTDATEPLTDPDEIPEPEEMPVTRTGDIWTLGNHRLMCGDSTNGADVALLMDGERADIAFTSPPYNLMSGFKVNPTQAKTKGYLEGENAYNEYPDDRDDEDYAKFLSDVLSNCLSCCDDVFFNIGYTRGALVGTALFLGQNAKYFCGAVAWIKNGCYMPLYPVQHGMLGNIYEPVYIFSQQEGRKTHHPQWKHGESSYNIVNTENACGNDYRKEHSATFPVKFAYEFIRRFSEKHVLDAFGGTGTTLIAAEQLGRKCYMMEIDPKYCDIIIHRWQNLTGKQATLDGKTYDQLRGERNGAEST